MTEQELLAEIRKTCAENSQAEEAERVGVSRQYLCDVLKGRRAVTAGLARAFGYERIVRYDKHSRV